jgi:hypothetical protein
MTAVKSTPNTENPQYPRFETMCLESRIPREGNLVPRGGLCPAGRGCRPARPRRENPGGHGRLVGGWGTPPPPLSPLPDVSQGCRRGETLAKDPTLGVSPKGLAPTLLRAGLARTTGKSVASSATNQRSFRTHERCSEVMSLCPNRG